MHRFPTVFMGIHIESIVPCGEPDIWKVIMSFQNSFRLLFEYLANNLTVFVEDIELGSLTITVKCSSLQILEGLWKDYITGRLNKVVQETLVTDAVLENLGLGEVKLNVFISEDEYESGKQIFMENLGLPCISFDLLSQYNPLHGEKMTGTRNES